MKSVTFPITSVTRLRRAAERARQSRDSGWLASAYNADRLIGVFDTLRLKPGFGLYVDQFPEDRSEDGAIWAVPTEASFVIPNACESAEYGRSCPPKPLHAVPLMQAVDGDGSPWSYLSASILRREAAEFGASWPGYVWTDQAILSKLPRKSEDSNFPEDELDLTNDSDAAEWAWHGKPPRVWEPTYSDRGVTKQIILHIRDPVGSDRIYRATDIYRAGSYDCTTRTKLLCTSGPGILY